MNPQAEKKDHIWSLRELRTHAYLETIQWKPSLPPHPPENKPEKHTKRKDPLPKKECSGVDRRHSLATTEAEIQCNNIKILSENKNFILTLSRAN